MADVVALDRITKKFADSTVIDQPSFSMHQGEIFGFLGPNGAGKTTLVNIITGLLDAEDGAVTLFEKYQPGDPPVTANIGLASQSLSLYDELTASENLQFFGQMQNLDGAGLEIAVAEVLQTVGLTDKAAGRVKTFSGA